MKYKHLILVYCFILLPCLAQAGQLFPPDNASGATTCPSGQVLKWVNNSVRCEDPSPGVTITGCPSGQMMTAVSSGHPVCAAVPSTPINVTCPSGQVLTGISNGSPVCTTLTVSAPVTVSCPSGYVLSAIANGTPTCVNNNGAFGGTYGVAAWSSYTNPLTGARSCPAGYHAVQTSHGTNSCNGCVWYTCYKD